jgi:hypothetical protein
MQAMLDELALAVTPGAHAVVILDRAGWHTANSLVIPANLTPVVLLPHSPEAERDRAGLALPARALPLAPAMADLQGRSRRLPRCLEPAQCPARTHPLLCSFDRLPLIKT